MVLSCDASLCPVPLSLNVNQMNYQLVFPTFIHVIQLYTISLEGQSKSLYICRIKFRCFIDFLFSNIRKAGSYQVLDDIIPYRDRKTFLGVCKTDGSGPPHACEARTSVAPWIRKFGYLSIREDLVIK